MAAKKPKPNLWILEAYYVGESIDLKKTQEQFKHYTFLNRDHPLVIQFLPNQYVTLTKFGVVTFWNVTKENRRQFLNELEPYVKARRTQYQYTESIDVIRGEKDLVTPRGVYLTDLDAERIKIVSYAVSQSVALERYEDEIEQHFGELDAVITNLKNTGKALLREKDLLKQVGRALSVKQTAIAHLSLFDKPEEVWESPELEKLYIALSTEFDLQTRFAVLDKKIEFLSENSRMLMEFMAEKRNAFLELVIIVLILIEIIPLALDFFRYFASHLR